MTRLPPRALISSLAATLLLACGDEATPAPSTDAVPAGSPPGEPGDVATEEPPGPPAPPGPAPIAVTAGEAHTCVLVAPSGPTGGSVYCWGRNELGELGAAGTGVVKLALPADAKPLLGVSAHPGGRTTCALDATSGVWCWGDNARGQAGAPASPSVAPTRLSIDGVAVKTNLLAVGAKHACLTRDGSDGSATACWGDNAKCQLGLTDDLGGCGPDFTSSPIVGGALSTTRNPRVLAPGDDFTCSLSGEDATVRCWGANDLGQCAQAPAASVATPGEVMVAETVAAGSGFACAVTSGAGKCWGSNAGHAISDDAAPTTSAPVDAFPGIAIATVGAGGAAVCAVDTSGRVHCRGTLPGRPTTAVNVVEGVDAVTSLAVGAKHVCVVGRRTGAAKASAPEVLCWGDNTSGQADPTRTGSAPITTPAAIALP